MRSVEDSEFKDRVDSSEVKSFVDSLRKELEDEVNSMSKNAKSKDIIDVVCARFAELHYIRLSASLQVLRIESLSESKTNIMDMIESKISRNKNKSKESLKIRHEIKRI